MRGSLHNSFLAVEAAKWRQQRERMKALAFFSFAFLGIAGCSNQRSVVHVPSSAIYSPLVTSKSLEEMKHSAPVVSKYLSSLRRPLSQVELQNVAIILRRYRVPGLREEAISKLAWNDSAFRDKEVLRVFRLKQSGLTLEQKYRCLRSPHIPEAKKVLTDGLMSSSDEEKISAIMSLIEDESNHPKICDALKGASTKVRKHIQGFSKKYSLKCNQ
jgi:hypothetical protein